MHALGGMRFEHGLEFRGHHADVVVIGGIHMVKGERVIELFFRRRQVFAQGRQDDIGTDAAILGAVAVDAVEHLHRQAQGAELGGARTSQLLAQVDDGLDRAFAVRRRIADDECPAIILQSRGHDLGALQRWIRFTSTTRGPL